MSDDENTQGPGGDKPEDKDKKKTADIIAWPGKRTGAADEGLPHDEAEDLVMKALSSITGRDPAELLRELRAREAAEAASGGAPSNVIDLDAARAARDTQHTVSGLDIGDLARAGFRAVMDELMQLQPQGGELIIDGDFVRTHGPTVFGNVLQQVGKALLARRQGGEEVESADVMSDVPEAEGEASHDAANDTDDPIPEPLVEPTPVDPARPVEIRFDFGNLAMSLLSRLGVFKGSAVADAKPTAAPKPEPETSPEPPVPDDEPPTV